MFLSLGEIDIILFSSNWNLTLQVSNQENTITDLDLRVERREGRRRDDGELWIQHTKRQRTVYEEGEDSAWAPYVNSIAYMYTREQYSSVDSACGLSVARSYLGVALYLPARGRVTHELGTSRWPTVALPPRSLQPTSRWGMQGRTGPTWLLTPPRAIGGMRNFAHPFQARLKSSGSTRERENQGPSLPSPSRMNGWVEMGMGAGAGMWLDIRNQPPQPCRALSVETPWSLISGRDRQSPGCAVCKRMNSRPITDSRCVMPSDHIAWGPWTGRLIMASISEKKVWRSVVTSSVVRPVLLRTFEA